MIIDSFIFFNEFDILDIRLEELYPAVDHFVIVESDTTFQGRRKSFYLAENLSRYEKYQDKLLVRSVSLPTSLNDPWEREFHQRNAIKDAVNVLTPPDDAIVLISDADEIPRRSVISTLDPDPVMGIGLDIFYYRLNVKDHHEHTIRAIRYSEFQKMTPQAIRTLDVDRLPRIYHAGWHFSYLGDTQHIITKFNSFAHSELNRYDTNNPDLLEARMAARQDLWGDGHTYEVVEIDDTWPEAIKNNREYWKKYEWKSV